LISRARNDHRKGYGGIGGQQEQAANKRGGRSEQDDREIDVLRPLRQKWPLTRLMGKAKPLHYLFEAHVSKGGTQRPGEWVAWASNTQWGEVAGRPGGRRRGYPDDDHLAARGCGHTGPADARGACGLGQEDR